MLVLGDILEQENFLEELSANWSIRKQIDPKGGENADSKRMSLVKRSWDLRAEECVPATE